ncbi:MAG: hypothetical protein JXA21_20965 [Anaerolineae bacterium]|nr:hypothetical protein [Anaerolineae bacterium]
MTKATFETTSDQLIVNLDALPFSFQFEKLPCPGDEQIARLVAHYVSASRVGRAKISSLLSKDSCIKLNIFAERMAMLSVRQNSPERLQEGLIALLMIDSRIDYRDVLMVLSLICHSAGKLGLDLESFFEKVLQYAYRPVVADSFRRFLRRESQDRSITAMGYREIEGPGGLVYWHFGDKPVPEGLWDG